MIEGFISSHATQDKTRERIELERDLSRDDVLHHAWRLVKTNRARPVRRVMISKADGSLRILGIPTVGDRVVQLAFKLIIEPISAAEFRANPYGFRPKKSVHDIVDDIANKLWIGYLFSSTNGCPRL